MSTTPVVLPLAVLLALVLSLLTALDAAAQPVGAFDGDPATTERIAAATPSAAALQVSAVRFADAGSAQSGRQLATHAVVATVSDFADSLVGAALTGTGPLLLTDPAGLDEAVGAELSRVLDAGAVVYVLGGVAALDEQVAADLQALGFTPRRLAGQTRVETAVAVADEILALHGPADTVLLARADAPADNPTAAWADSMAGGSLAAASATPILVTPTTAVHPAVAAWLAANTPQRTILLGGEAALADAVRQAVPGPQRLAGPERTATAAAIAGSDLWPASDQRRHVILDGGRPDGWAYGLSAAGLAADAAAPPLLVVGTVTPETRRLVSTCGPAEVDLVLVGDDTVIGADVLDALTTFDGQACAPEFTSLTPFVDCDETLRYFVEEGMERVGPYGLDSFYYGSPEVLVDPVPAPVQEEPAAGDGDSGGEAPPAAPTDGEGGGADEDGVSGTNTQEVGVDEPDIVKATSQAAYVATGMGVEVIAISTDTPPAHVRTLDVPGEAFGHELLLDDGVLLVLGRGSGYERPVESPPGDTAFAPELYYPEPTTEIARYDLADPTNPVLLDATTIDGDYRSARMVDGTVRLVTSSNPSGLHFVFPGDGSQEAEQAALEHNRAVIAESTLEDWLPQVGADADARPAVACDQVFTPPGFSGISTVLVTTIDVATSVTPTSSAAVVAQGETIYASTERLVVSSSQWGVWTDEVPEAVSTQLHSFDISDPAGTTYVGSGQVPGYVLNSFALSERDGYYRVATTTEPPWRDDFVDPGQTDNGITILTEGGSELFEVGRVFGLGAGERIFAVRYLGDLAAVVTFRQVDPLYLVDLTLPTAPRVTGELKIPGVSRYLHPLDGDHLLGVGQDGTDDGQLTGLQVSLFDISDRSTPTRVDSIEFGPGDSPVEFDHKAFLLWAPLGRALVPSNLYGPDYNDYQPGVQAIDIDTAAQTLTLAGQVQQPDAQGYRASIDRTFVAGSTLYTVSAVGVGAHDLVTLADEGFAGFPNPGGGCCVAID